MPDAVTRSSKLACEGAVGSVHGEHLLPPRLSGKDDAPRICQNRRTFMVESPDFFRVKSDMSPSEFGLKSDLDFALDYPLQDLGIVLMLSCVNARLEVIKRVVRQHGDLMLEDDWALVVLSFAK